MESLLDIRAMSEEREMNKVEKNEWVQISNVVLPAGERAPQVPEDTQNTDLKMWTKGFLNKNAEIGQEVEIITVTGRKVKGELFKISPKYIHTYGDFVPELLRIQRQVKNILGGIDHE